MEVACAKILGVVLIGTVRIKELPGQLPNV